MTEHELTFLYEQLDRIEDKLDTVLRRIAQTKTRLADEEKADQANRRKVRKEADA